MKRTTPALAALLALVFAAGWLVAQSTSAPHAQAAPAGRWTRPDQTYYNAAAPALADLDAAVAAFFEQITADADAASAAVDDAQAAAEALAGLDAPPAMLAVRALAAFAANECTNTLDFFAGMDASALTGGFGMPVLIEMRDHCALALRDARVELARVAAANGGPPPAP